MKEFSSFISELPIGELLQKSLVSTPCVNVRKNAKVRVVTGMLVQYLETFIDSIVVRDDTNPIGVIGGKEIIQGVFKKPSSDFFELNLVEDITDKRITEIVPDTTLKELISLWRDSGRAFAIINTNNENYSVVSAKKILEIGMNCNSEFCISQIPKKNIAMFGKEATIGDVIKLMLTNKSRKILLEGTHQFINDRIIIEIIEKFKYLQDQENFLQIPASIITLDDARVVSDDLNLSQISKIMYNMSHPCVIYEDKVITPWDVCIALGKV